MSIYVYVLNDTPGVVAANNFISFFNPTGSTVTMSPVLVTVSNYDTGSSTSPDSMTIQRTSAASGGTLVAASTIGRFQPAWPDPQVQIRIGNPTVTTTGLVLAAYPPPFAGIPALGAVEAVTAPPGTSFLCPPGTGLVFATAAGNTSQVWNLELAWAETP